MATPLVIDEVINQPVSWLGRKPHERGDATRGWVDHDYSVTTGEPAAKEQSP